MIIPAYNVAGYLPRCLDSVLGQTYTDLEIVAVDDGSADDTLTVLHAYAERDDRVRVFTQPNSGVSGARNRGLDNATGEYVFFLDGDDWLAPDALEQLLNADADADIVQGVHANAHENGEVEPITVKEATLTDPCEIVQSYFFNHIQESSCNKLFRRTAIGDVRFDETLAVAEDSKFVYAVLKQTKCVRLIADITYYYYIRSDSCVHDALADKHFAVLTLRDAQYEEIQRDASMRRAFACKYVQDVFHLIHCVLQDASGTHTHRLPSLRKRVLRLKGVLLTQKTVSTKLKIGVLLLWLAPSVFYRTYRRIRAVE